MQHPDTFRIREIVKAIVEAREENEYPETVDMSSIDDPMCGTPGCHAGELFMGMISTMDMRALVNSVNVIKYKFLIVENMFAGYLFHDFESVDVGHLEQWAHEYPELWGNRHGSKMFFSGAAFGRSGYTFPPSVITDHWLAVADRIDALPG